MHPRDAVDPRKQDGVVYEITYECSKVYIAEMGRWKHEWIKELERHIRLSRTQSSAVSERANKTAHYLLWDEVKFIDKDLHIVLLATLIRGGGGITSTRPWTGHLCQNKVVSQVLLQLVVALCTVFNFPFVYFCGTATK